MTDIAQEFAMSMYASTADRNAAMLAEIERLRADAIRTQNEVVMPLRERISQLLAVPIIAERDALRAEVAGLREDALRYRWLRENEKPSAGMPHRPDWSVLF